MYSYKLLEAPRPCASCGKTVAARVAGHYFSDPLCASCFNAAAPELAAATEGRQPETSIELLETSSCRCTNCGDRIESRFAGHHRGEPLCPGCFRKHAPVLTALLHLDEVAWDAVNTRDAKGLLLIVDKYTHFLHKRDAKHPRKASPGPSTRSPARSRSLRPRTRRLKKR